MKVFAACLLISMFSASYARTTRREEGENQEEPEDRFRAILEDASIDYEVLRQALEAVLKDTNQTMPEGQEEMEIYGFLKEICESQDAEAAQILQMHFNSTVAAKINGDDSSLCAQLEELEKSGSSTTTLPETRPGDGEK